METKSVCEITSKESAPRKTDSEPKTPPRLLIPEPASPPGAPRRGESKVAYRYMGGGERKVPGDKVTGKGMGRKLMWFMRRK